MAKVTSKNISFNSGNIYNGSTIVGAYRWHTDNKRIRIDIDVPTFCWSIVDNETEAKRLVAGRLNGAGSK